MLSGDLNKNCNIFFDSGPIEWWKNKGRYCLGRLAKRENVRFSSKKVFKSSIELFILLWGIFPMPLNFLILVFFFFFSWWVLFANGQNSENDQFFSEFLSMSVWLIFLIFPYNFLLGRFIIYIRIYTRQLTHDTHNTHKQTHRHDNTTGKGGVTDCTHQPNIYFKSPYNMRVI